MECPTVQMTKEMFTRPFSDFWTNYFTQYPDTAMVKVIPPKGWLPRKGPFQNLDRINIQCPTKQLVMGKKGYYIVALIEQKPCTVLEFRKKTMLKEHKAPTRKEQEPESLERSFWKSVTINPPYYGADTPQSFFDKDNTYGWNLRNLGCLLQQDFVPQIPGVTSPMTYFGMWKSFFAWHKEDVDLYSINYMHFGAPKVWYCVAPSERQKFEQMASSLYPDMARNCGSFLRHKEVLISPTVLKAFGINYYHTMQRENEFIVLNAAAYHSGYNLGFNCAEAINFALPLWIPVGLNASRCQCGIMRDGVRISMDSFVKQYPQYVPRKVPKKSKSLNQKSSSRKSKSRKKQSVSQHKINKNSQNICSYIPNLLIQISNKPQEESESTPRSTPGKQTNVDYPQYLSTVRIQQVKCDSDMSTETLDKVLDIEQPTQTSSNSCVKQERKGMKTRRQAAVG